MKKIISMLTAFAVIIPFFVLTANAATGKEGYAVYRDGVLSGIEWHAGLMDEANSAMSLPVTHIFGPLYTVSYASWNTGSSSFIDGNTFKGVYRSNVAPSSAQRDNIKATGRKLITEKIPYTAVAQLNSVLFPSGTWLKTNELTSMRCDGVVEYCYEWYALKIYGSTSLWDVTNKSISNWNHHSGTAITPKKQSQNNMTLVSSLAP